MKLIRNEQEWNAFRDKIMRSEDCDTYIVDANSTYDEHNNLGNWDYTEDTIPSYPCLVDYVYNNDGDMQFVAVTVEDAEELLSAAQAMFRPMESGSVEVAHTCAGIYTGILVEL
jgi:hypothetical protein